VDSDGELNGINSLPDSYRRTGSFLRRW